MLHSSWLHLDLFGQFLSVFIYEPKKSLRTYKIQHLFTVKFSELMRIRVTHSYYSRHTVTIITNVLQIGNSTHADVVVGVENEICFIPPSRISNRFIDFEGKKWERQKVCSYVRTTYIDIP